MTFAPQVSKTAEADASERGPNASEWCLTLLLAEQSISDQRDEV